MTIHIPLKHFNVVLAKHALENILPIAYFLLNTSDYFHFYSKLLKTVQ